MPKESTAVRIPLEAENDLICDAVQEGSQESSCCCTPQIVIDAFNDLRKVKVAQVVQKKAARAVASGTEIVLPLSTEAEVQDNVIERLEDIKKPHLDAYTYRYFTYA